MITALNDRLDLGYTAGVDKKQERKMTKKITNEAASKLTESLTRHLEEAKYLLKLVKRFEKIKTDASSSDGDIEDFAYSWLFPALEEFHDSYKSFKEAKQANFRQTRVLTKGKNIIKID